MKKKIKNKNSGESLLPFDEREVKLNARDAGDLIAVRDYFLADPHYVPVNVPRFRPKWLKDMGSLGPAVEVTSIRTRTYYDDRKLNGFNNGLEIRVECKKGNGCKQVVKVGSNNAGDDGAFRRMEYPASLKRQKPDLTLVASEAKNALRKIFNVNCLADVKLQPMLEISSQRWRMSYHPDGDPDTIVECALDVGRGRTFGEGKSYEWPLYQVEIEVKKGNPSILDKEKDRLKRRFDFLTVGKESKPSPGFEAVRAAGKNPAPAHL